MTSIAPESVKTVTIRGITYAIPFADLLPPLTAREYEALKVDIARRGVVVPVIIDDRNNVIDGQHRMLIAAELNLGFVPTKKAEAGLTDKQKRELCHDLNVHRRQLTAEERQIAALRLRSVGQSYRQIGETLGVSHFTARNDVEKATGRNLPVEATGTDELVEESLPERITGRDGKSRPATQPARTIAPPAPPAVEQPFTYLERDEPEWATTPHAPAYDATPIAPTDLPAPLAEAQQSPDADLIPAPPPQLIPGQMTAQERARQEQATSDRYLAATKDEATRSAERRAVAHRGKRIIQEQINALTPALADDLNPGDDQEFHWLFENVEVWIAGWRGKLPRRLRPVSGEGGRR